MGLEEFGELSGIWIPDPTWLRRRERPPMALIGANPANLITLHLVEPNHAVRPAKFGRRVPPTSGHAAAVRPRVASDRSALHSLQPIGSEDVRADAIFSRPTVSGFDGTRHMGWDSPPCVPCGCSTGRPLERRHLRPARSGLSGGARAAARGTAERLTVRRVLCAHRGWIGRSDGR